MIVSIQNGLPYVLNQTPTDYYWEGDLSVVLPSPPVFAANGSLSNLTIADPAGGSGATGLGFKADGITLAPTQPATPVQFSQSTYATWAPPALFLSMAVYTLSTIGGTVAQIETAGLTGAIPANNLILLPLIWYYPGTSGCVNTSLNTPGDSLVTWFCNINPQSYGTCPNPLVTQGWTDLNDCTAGIEYTYCPVGQTCGASNCNGPCPTTATTCTLATGTFSCQGTTELWTQPWFLVVIIGLGLVAVILFIVAIILANKGKDKDKNKSKAEPLIESDYVNY